VLTDATSCESSALLLSMASLVSKGRSFSYFRDEDSQPMLKPSVTTEWSAHFQLFFTQAETAPGEPSQIFQNR
jgi:hypothetical protein